MFNNTFRRSTAVCIALFCLAPRAHAADGPKPVVVMISVDGLAGYYLDDPKADVPTLRELARDGVRATSMKAANPTVTWVNHATLVTGDYPARHGVDGNNVYDRTTKKKLVLISDPELDAGQIYRVPTVYDLAHAAGLKTVGLRWPVTRAAKGLDECIPDMSDDTEMLKFSTPDLIARGKDAGIFDAGDFVPADREKHPQLKDEAITRMAEMVLRDDGPNLLLVHLIDVDHTEHEHGPRSPQAYEAVHAADGYVRRIRDALQHQTKGRGTLIVVSDHGFSPVDHQILPNVMLRDAGLIKVVGARVVAGDVANIVQGGADLIYLTNPARHDADMEKIRAAFKDVRGIDKILTPADFPAYGIADPKADPHAPDMVLMAQEGYGFGDTSNGAVSVQDKPERKGSHGHNADIPDLHATFVAWGAGLRAGTNLGEIKNIDVAPTVATLLGLTMPDVDGKPLEAALLP